MRATQYLITLGIIFAIGTGAPMARETPSGTLRVFYEMARPTGDSDIFVGSPFNMNFPVAADDTNGLGVFYELRKGQWVGIDLGFMFLKYDLKITNMDLGFASASVVPLIFGVPIHVLGGKKPVDLYIEPLLSLNAWGDLEGTAGGSGMLEPEIGVGVALGLDVPFGKSNWQLNLAYRYITMTVDDGVDQIPVDPWIAEIGIGYRFR